MQYFGVSSLIVKYETFMQTVVKDFTMIKCEKLTEYFTNECLVSPKKIWRNLRKIVTLVLMNAWLQSN